MTAKWLVGIEFNVPESGAKVKARFVQSVDAAKIDQIKAAFTRGVPAEWFFQPLDAETLQTAKQMMVIAGGRGNYTLLPANTVDFRFDGMATPLLEAEIWGARNWGTPTAEIEAEKTALEEALSRLKADTK